MTLTLELPNDLSAQIERAANGAGVPLEVAALDALRGGLARDAAPERRGVSRLRGRYPSSRTVADFMADRSSEEGEEAPQSEA